MFQQARMHTFRTHSVRAFAANVSNFDFLRVLGLPHVRRFYHRAVQAETHARFGIIESRIIHFRGDDIFHRRAGALPGISARTNKRAMDALPSGK